MIPEHRMSFGVPRGCRVGVAVGPATLRGGGHIVKVLAHVEMIGQLRTFAPQSTWWAPLWSRGRTGAL